MPKESARSKDYGPGDSRAYREQVWDLRFESPIWILPAWIGKDRKDPTRDEWGP